MYSCRPAGKDASVEERVAALEFNLNETRTRMDGIYAELHRDIRRTIADLQDEQVARANTDQKIDRKLEETTVGGIHISLMGLVWLIIGVTMSTAPKELINFIR